MKAKKKKKQLYQCAVDVEQDQALNAERDAWNTTIGDGIDEEQEDLADLDLARNRVQDKEAVYLNSSLS